MPPTRVAILDDYAGIARAYFEHIPEIQIDEYSDTIVPSTHDDSAALIERLKPYSIICGMRERTPFPASVLSALPNLKLLATTGPYNLAIDLEAARANGIVVSGTERSGNTSHPKLPSLIRPHPSYDATNQQCFALLLSLASRIPADNANLRSGGDRWQTGLGFTLSNKVFGCCGLGRLGSAAARTAALGFGMKIVAWSQNLTQEKADKVADEIGLGKGGIRALSKEEFLKTIDVLSIHYLLTDRSRGLLGKDELALLKKSAVIVNTSRGPIIDEAALLDVLQRGAIRGAALDVYNVEPLPKTSAWRTTKWGEDGRSEVVLSPHMGYVVDEMLHCMYADQAVTVERFLKGEPLPVLLKRKG